MTITTPVSFPLLRGTDEFVSHPRVTVPGMDRHLLPGALGDACLLAVTLLFLYLAVLACATFAPA